MNRERVELFAEVLADPKNNFAITLERLAPKKHPIMNIRAYQKYL